MEGEESMVDIGKQLKRQQLEEIKFEDVKPVDGRTISNDDEEVKDITIV